MEIIGAAALIAVGIVLAAILYGRMHAARPAVVTTDQRPTPAPDTDSAKRTEALAEREHTLARHEAELEQQRAQLIEQREELERTLEKVSGLIRRARQADAAQGD